MRVESKDNLVACSGPLGRMAKRMATGLSFLLGEGARTEISPSVVTSRSWNPFNFKIILGSEGLASDDSFGMVCGSNIDRWQFQFASHIWGCYTPWQTHDPAAPNFLTAVCDRRDVNLNIRIGSSGGLKPFLNRPDHFVRSLLKRFRYVLEIIPDRKLNPGDIIYITWGNTLYGSPGVQAPALAYSYYFLPFKFSLLPKIDVHLPIRRGDFDALPSIRVKGKSAVKLHCAVKPLVGRGEKLSMHCAAIDEYGNLDEEFRGVVRIKASDGTARFPSEIRFTKCHSGRRTIAGIQFKKIGWHSVVVHGSGIKSSPHPVLVSKAKPQEQIFFGDMHGHTLDGDGTLRDDEHYRYAKEVAGLDFCSMTSHAEYFGSEQAWKKYLEAATKAHEPGKFIVFYGYEWAGQGHVNAYFLEEKDATNIYGSRLLLGKHPADAPGFRIPCNKEKRFLKLLKATGREAFCITHFHSKFVSPFDDNASKLYEIYSTHQQNPLEAKFQELLSRGLKVGIVAGSDSHRLPIGSLCLDPDKVWNQPVIIDGHIGSQSMQKKCGLQATFSPSLSRRNLYNGMNIRSTYGTTGARIILLFEINGASMGEELSIGFYTELHLSARVGGTAQLLEVCVLKYDGKKWSNLLKKLDTGKMTCDIKYKIPPSKNDSIYYLRVVQTDGEQAWSSPIWIRKGHVDDISRYGANEELE